MKGKTYKEISRKKQCRERERKDENVHDHEAKQLERNESQNKPRNAPGMNHKLRRDEKRQRWQSQHVEM